MIRDSIDRCTSEEVHISYCEDYEGYTLSFLFSYNQFSILLRRSHLTGKVKVPIDLIYFAYF